MGKEEEMMNVIQMRKIKIWIYEYKDGDSPIGATFLNEFVDNIDIDDLIKLPHLQEPWHWRIEFKMEEDEQ
tara:strand:- start:330 stop:542 length:213 start_codon:yes stop_codon:yes gene_type:complete